MAENDEDAGKVVQVEAPDRYGNTVKEDLVLLPYQQITSTKSALSGLTYQRKGVTSGGVVGYVTYPVKRPDRLLRLPAATQVASFHRKKLPLSFGCSSGVLSIIGKLRFTPLVSKTDLMPICDVMALSFALQALTALKRRDLQAYNASLEFSVNELEKEMRDVQPAGAVSQMSVKSPTRFNQRCWN